MRRCLVLVVVGSLGCGDDLDPNQCLPDGFAEGEATVAGEPLGPFARAALITTPGARHGVTHALVFDEVAGACGETATTGRHLSLLFCDAPIRRDYIAVGLAEFRCPGDNVLALVERDGGVDVATAAGGTISVTTTGGCIGGSYMMQFASGTEMLEGAFDAAVCAAK